MHDAKGAIFEHRYDAGRKLAALLEEYRGKPLVVLAIPNGGVAVGLSVALALAADLDLVISRKIPLPLSPEGGFGAVTDDGTIMLSEDIVKSVGLTPQQIEYQVSQVRADIRRRRLLYYRDMRPQVLSGKTAILVDDGLASGYTMLAAVESVRHRRPQEIVVAVPVGPASTVEKVGKAVNNIVTCAVGTEPRFYVSDYYRYWHDFSDEEVVQCLKEWRIRRYQSIIELPGKGA